MNTIIRTYFQGGIPGFTIKKWRNVCHCPKRKSGQVFKIYRPIVKTVTFLPWLWSFWNNPLSKEFNFKYFKNNDLCVHWSAANNWHTICFILWNKSCKTMVLYHFIKFEQFVTIFMWWNLVDLFFLWEENWSWYADFIIDRKELTRKT